MSVLRALACPLAQAFVTVAYMLAAALVPGAAATLTVVFVLSLVSLALLDRRPTHDQ